LEYGADVIGASPGVRGFPRKFRGNARGLASSPKIRNFVPGPRPKRPLDPEGRRAGFRARPVKSPAPTPGPTPPRETGKPKPARNIRNRDAAFAKPTIPREGNPGSPRISPEPPESPESPKGAVNRRAGKTRKNKEFF
jgi:hypothetical protein